MELVERLIWKGFDLKSYDKNVELASIVGANRDYILNHIPHISKLMVDTMEDIFDHSKSIVLGNDAPEFQDALKNAKPNQSIIDSSGIDRDASTEGQYEGICW